MAEDQAPKKGRPLITYLFIPLLSSIIIIGTAGTIFSVINAVSSVETLANAHTESLCKRVSDHLEVFLENPLQAVKIDKNLILSNLLDYSDQDQLQTYLYHQVLEYPTISSVYFGSSSGGFAGAGREGDPAEYYITGTRDFTPGTFYKTRIDDVGKPTETLAEFNGFDARTRPWYTGAVETQKTFWTEPYPLFTGQDLAIAVSMPVYSLEKRELLGVFSTDLFFSQLGSFLEKTSNTINAHLALLDEDGMLLATSGKEIPLIKEGSTFKRLPGSMSSNEVIRKGSILLEENGKKLKPTGPGNYDLFAFRERYFMHTHIFNTPGGDQWTMMLAVPANQFLGRLYFITQLTIGLIGLVILIEIFVSIFLARRLIAPLHSLIDSMSHFPDDAGIEKRDNFKIAEFEEVKKAYNRGTGRVRELLDKLQSEVNQRTGAENELRKEHKLLLASLEEKEVLLKEVYHRTKNNLNFVISLVRLHMLSGKEGMTSEDMETLIGKIQSIMLVNRKLYQTSDLENLDLGTYLQEVAELQVESVSEKFKQIELKTDIEAINIDMDRAVSCGLIVSELVSNTLKYAFPRKIGGEIELTIKPAEENKIEIRLCNDGVQLPDGFDIRGQQGLGLNLVTEITEHQLEGTVTFENSKGVCFTILFPR